ncbi:MAG: hypothetical protein JRG95_15605 [Deltaproteobacteria bacterium]|nr:hypothetical protein [Deltaproteobacteria bacterium]
MTLQTTTSLRKPVPTAPQTVPTIRDLRSRVEEIRVGAIEHAARRLGFDDMREDQREGIDMLTRSIVDKLLHSPLANLRAEAGREEGLVMLEATRELFGLDDLRVGPDKSMMARDLFAGRAAR